MTKGRMNIWRASASEPFRNRLNNSDHQKTSRDVSTSLDMTKGWSSAAVMICCNLMNTSREWVRNNKL